MVPTVAWMRQKFAEYNKKYFGGKIIMPTLRVANLTDRWGNYNPNAEYNWMTRKISWSGKNRGVLTLTNAFDRPEKSVISTLLHEMAHAYVSIVMGLWPKNLHGPEFMAATEQIRADGWNINSETMQTQNDVRGKNDNEKTSILCLIKNPQADGYKYWICKATQQNMQQIRAVASRIQGVQSVEFYQVKSDAFTHVQSNPQNLFGWGGDTYTDAALKMAKYCGITPNQLAAENLERIK